MPSCITYDDPLSVGADVKIKVCVSHLAGHLRQHAGGVFIPPCGSVPLCSCEQPKETRVELPWSEGEVAQWSRYSCSEMSSERAAVAVCICVPWPCLYRSVF
ncbi:hypothetical protein UPYG_G00248400 [Umbra pygmaea]|uniref:Uncharacterized protein n=1 Tax=Umbra pygmaea TaxID=75934 RepID=A0ABD0WQS5_UMBPY